MKLGSSTHGWDGGQRLINLEFHESLTRNSTAFLEVYIPEARIQLIVPSFYMLFYVDCLGKPSVAQMVRFDDQAKEP